MQEEKRRLINSAAIFTLIVSVLWVIKLIEMMAGVSFARFGLLPLQAKGLPGILFSPLIHADLAHLAANSAPLFVLGTALMFYYRKYGLHIFFFSWVLTGIWVWLFARGNNYHIGASGVVYALAAFHFTSGIIRREPRLMAFSLLVIFLYGSMVWGVFPEFFPDRNISWESHLMGFLAGIILAYAYRKNGPEKKVYEWPDEEADEEDDGTTPYWAKEDRTLTPYGNHSTSTEGQHQAEDLSDAEKQNMRNTTD